MDPFYKGKPKRPASPRLTDEEIAARRAANDAFIAAFFESRGMTILKDREARVAVEGDTDLNHDNVEPAE